MNNECDASQFDSSSQCGQVPVPSIAEEELGLALTIFIATIGEFIL